jgi:2-haloacid dehalogenase
MRLSDFSTLTFDCYGTLVDWETGMYAALQPLWSRASGKPSREDVLKLHAQYESTQELQTPTMRYSQLLAIVYKRLAEALAVTASWSECEAYGRSVRNWPAFPDSAEALAYLKKHYKLVILSNVDNESFSVSNARLGVTFDAIITAEDVGSYKPSQRNFTYMLETLAGLGIEKGKILHTAESLFHDHKPANEIGLRTCWIHRRHAQGGFGATRDPGGMPQIDFRFTSLGEMAAAHRAETGG